jgi:sulfonate transport system ATP-binding protein
MGAALSITVRGLSKSYAGRSVIADFDLHVPAGQFLAVVGRSGCGKSTLLRLLSGLEQPDAGTLRFGDLPAGTLPASDIRLMFQEARLLPWAKVGANVEVGLKREGGRDARSQSLDVLAQVGLADRVDQWPATLSGGQKQRVALARALVSHPRILSFDEPLGALDALTRIEMQQLIERVFIEQGFTAVLVTHDVGEALALADRIILLDKGGIALDVDVPLARPRRRGSPEAAALEDRILTQLLGSGS